MTIKKKLILYKNRSLIESLVYVTNNMYIVETRVSGEDIQSNSSKIKLYC